MKSAACPLRRASHISTRYDMRSTAFTSVPEYQAVIPIVVLPNGSSALAIADGSSLNDIAGHYTVACLIVPEGGRASPEKEIEVDNSIACDSPAS